MSKILVMIFGLSMGTVVTNAAEGDTQPKPNPNPPRAIRKLPEQFQKYDKNGNGKLDKEELADIQKDRQAEALKKYDKNGDGTLDDTEKMAKTADRRKELEELSKKRQAEVDKMEKEREQKK